MEILNKTEFELPIILNTGDFISLKHTDRQGITRELVYSEIQEYMEFNGAVIFKDNIPIFGNCLGAFLVEKVPS